MEEEESNRYLWCDRGDFIFNFSWFASGSVLCLSILASAAVRASSGSENVRHDAPDFCIDDPVRVCGVLCMNA